MSRAPDAKKEPHTRHTLSAGSAAAAGLLVADGLSPHAILAASARLASMSGSSCCAILSLMASGSERQETKRDRTGVSPIHPTSGSTSLGHSITVHPGERRIVSMEARVSLCIRVSGASCQWRQENCTAKHNHVARLNCPHLSVPLLSPPLSYLHWRRRTRREEQWDLPTPPFPVYRAT